MEEVSICESMNWSYDEYLSQPGWFIELLKAKKTIDSDNAKKQIDKIK